MRVVRSKKAFATPVSLTFLLFSFTILTVATYYFAVSSVNNRVGRLNYAATKQDMLMLENHINSIAWSPGSSVIQTFQGYGKEFETKPSLRHLVINVTLGSTSDVVFNSTIGYVRYEAPAADRGEVGEYLKGDDEQVINRSFSSMAQMYIRINGDDHEIYLGYRPLAVSFLDTSETDTVNVVRIFILNLNSSESLLFTGSFRLRIRCVNVTSETWNYNLTGQVDFAKVKATVEGDEGTVYLPLSSNGSYTLVRLEVLVCNVRLEEVTL